MKKAIVALAIAAFASTAMAVVAGGPHDLSAKPGSTMSSCQYCHAPHYANTAGGYASIALWNRNSPSTASYQTNGSIAAMGSGSWACLSCHDGVSDMGGTYSKPVGTLTTPNMANNSYANVGRAGDGTWVAGTPDLRDDHPVGVVLPVSTEYETAANITGAGGLTLYTYGATTNVVECSSCHYVHGTADGAIGGPSYLRASATVLCSTCHLK